MQLIVGTDEWVLAKLQPYFELASKAIIKMQVDLEDPKEFWGFVLLFGVFCWRMSQACIKYK